MDPSLAPIDRVLGGAVINRWTYKAARLLSLMLRPRVDTSTVHIEEGLSGDQGGLIVRPKEPSGEGAVLLIHGGGYVIGSPAEALSKATFLARACKVPVLCPAYRLAPEHPFPAPLDDCQEAWRSMLDHAGALGIAPEKIVVGGISAGGGLAASLAQRLLDEGGVQPAAQLLIYPMLDDATATRRELDTPRHRVWSNRNNLFGWQSYLGHSLGRDAAHYAVPAHREDLSHLPPAWIGVGTADLFLDEDRAYAQRLMRAGVEVDYVEVQGGIHAFDISHAEIATIFNQAQADFVHRFTR